MYKTISIALVSFLLSFPLLAKAACGENQGNAWIADMKTGHIIQKIEGGKITECANASGGFESFEKDDFSVGLAICNDNCEKGFKENVLYVRIQKEWKEGEFIENQGYDSTCVHAFGDKNKYCWKVIDQN